MNTATFGQSVPSTATPTTTSTTTPTAKSKRGYAGQTAAALQQQRQERLIEAAMQLFGTQGYAATPIEQLCRQAKVATRYFYEAFLDKETLLCTLFDQLMQDTFQQVSQTLLDTSTPLADRLNQGLAAFMHAQLEDARRARITAIEILGVSAKTEAHRQKAMNQFVNLIETYCAIMVQQHQWPVRHYRVWGVAIVGAMHELQISHLNQPDAFDQATILSELRHIVALLQQHNT